MPRSLSPTHLPCPFFRDCYQVMVSNNVCQFFLLHFWIFLTIIFFCSLHSFFHYPSFLQLWHRLQFMKPLDLLLHFPWLFYLRFLVISQFFVNCASDFNMEVLPLPSLWISSPRRVVVTSVIVRVLFRVELLRAHTMSPNYLIETLKLVKFVPYSWT